MRTDKGAYEKYYTESPDHQTIDQEFQYFGYGAVRYRQEFNCWCGNTPPFRPRPMKDCHNGVEDSSRIYTITNSSKFNQRHSICFIPYE